MFKVIGSKTKRVYGSSRTRAGAEKIRRRVAMDHYLMASYFKIIGPVCKFCGKACPCGKAKEQS